MRKTLILLLTFTLVVIGCKDNSFRISGKLTDIAKGQYIYLRELGEQQISTLDSVKLEGDGTFAFEGEIKIPAFFMLVTTSDSYLTMLVTPGENINITSNYNSLNSPEKLTGSIGTEKMLEYNKALRSTLEKLDGLRDVYMQNADSKDLPKIIATLDSTAQGYLRELNSFTKKFVDDNIGSMVSLTALYQQLDANTPVLNPVEDLSYFVKVDSSLYSRWPDSPTVKVLHEQVQALVQRVNAEKGQGVLTDSGSKVPEIALPAPSGEVISLSSTRGKVVLLDFWAAWCPPCRRENPNLVSAYNKYSSKGFQIFQVSLDKSKEEWVRAIEQDNLGKWIHVSDLKYWNSMVVPLFKIESIPYNILLDREGNVIASNLRGDKLEEKLAELFSN